MYIYIDNRDGIHHSPVCMHHHAPNSMIAHLQEANVGLDREMYLTRRLVAHWKCFLGLGSLLMLETNS